MLERGAEIHGEARIVNHSSIARKSVLGNSRQKYLEKNGGNSGGNNIGITGGGRWVRYGQTKLANAAFTAALHEKLQAKGSKIKALGHIPAGRTQNCTRTPTSVVDCSSPRWFPSLQNSFRKAKKMVHLAFLSCAVLPNAQSGDFWGPGSNPIASKGPANSFP